MKRMHTKKEIQDDAIDALAIEGVTISDGKITAPEILEINEGYSFRKSAAAANFDIKYAGAVKTGNKLTLTVSGIITKGASVYASMGQFVIPPDIWSMLVPLRDNIIDTHRIYVNNATSRQGEALDTGLGKGNSNDNLDIYTYGSNNLANETEYIFRYEVTFLLGDNLAA